MQAGLLPPAMPVADDMIITMLDGGLGAVAGSSDTELPPVCWCDCVVCTSGTPLTK